MPASLNTIAFLPKPGSIHQDTLRERRALLAHNSRGDQLAVVWCWRNSTGGYYHAGSQTWVLYSGASFNLSDFIALIEGANIVLPARPTLDAWCLAVRKPEGRAN